MGAGESFGFAEATSSGVDASLSLPFINNAEIVFGDGADFTNSGVGNSNPSTTGTQSASASASPTGGGNGLPGSSLSSPQADSGMSAVIWVSIAGIVVAVLLAMKK